MVNGSAEEPATVGWTGALGRATHGVSGYPLSVNVDENGLSGEMFDGSAALFTGARGASTAFQTIDLSPAITAIDNENVGATAPARTRAFRSTSILSRTTPRAPVLLWFPSRCVSSTATWK